MAYISRLCFHVLNETFGYLNCENFLKILNLLGSYNDKIIEILVKHSQASIIGHH